MLSHLCCVCLVSPSPSSMTEEEGFYVLSAWVAGDAQPTLDTQWMFLDGAWHIQDPCITPLRTRDLGSSQLCTKTFLLDRELRQSPALAPQPDSQALAAGGAPSPHDGRVTGLPVPGRPGAQVSTPAVWTLPSFLRETQGPPKDIVLRSGLRGPASQTLVGAKGCLSAQTHRLCASLQG